MPERLRIPAQSLAWSSKEDGEMREAIVRWSIAMPYAMKAHCWRKRRMQRDLEVRLSAALAAAQDLAAAARLSAIGKRA
jgi:hypothetical protein